MSNDLTTSHHPNQIKIAILLPIGRIDRFGYQHLYKLILKNHCEFANKVFLLSSSRFVSPDLFRDYSNTELVTLEDTLPDLIDGREVMNLTKFAHAFDQCQQMIKDQGYDVCINIHINQYIPRPAFEPLRAVCTELVRMQKPFAWLYKKYQLRDVLFDADCRLPWILNMANDQIYQFGADSLIDNATGEAIRIDHQNFRKYNSQAIVDILGEYTLQDAKDKYEYTIKEHRKLNGTFDPNNSSNLIFRPDVFFQYNIGKINQKYISNTKLDDFGNQIVKYSRPDFVSNKFRSEYSLCKNGWYRRLKRSLKAAM